MDTSHVTPFVESAQHVFTTMLQLEVAVEQPALRVDGVSGFDVSAMVGLHGDLVGSVVLSFPTETAERIATLLIGEPVTQTSEDFADAICELCNMVCGGAKAGFEGKQLEITAPVVVVGQNHHVARQKEKPCVAITCEADCGMFVIEVGVQPAVSAAGVSAAA